VEQASIPALFAEQHKTDRVEDIDESVFCNKAGWTADKHIRSDSEP